MLGGTGTDRRGGETVAEPSTTVADDVRYREARAGDADFLARMLVMAAAWRSEGTADPAAVLADPAVAHYIAGWPRDGDLGIVAENARGDRLGGAWVRSFPADEPGHGYVAHDVPELSIAVDRAHRGRGVGGTLLRRTLSAAALRGDRRVSLSVEHDNPAIRLYLALGFRVVHSSATTATMIVDLAPPR
jgi:ribosomal protein S18 acetylase RimI-like enzyme